MYYITFGLSQACCFHPSPVFVLSNVLKAKHYTTSCISSLICNCLFCWNNPYNADNFPFRCSLCSSKQDFDITWGYLIWEPTCAKAVPADKLKQGLRDICHRIKLKLIENKWALLARNIMLTSYYDNSQYSLETTLKLLAYIMIHRHHGSFSAIIMIDAKGWHIIKLFNLALDSISEYAW